MTDPSLNKLLKVGIIGTVIAAGKTGRVEKQGDCCKTWPESKEVKTSSCPSNGEKGQSLDAETLRHLIKKERLSEIKDAGYFFCKAFDCDIVYYHPQNGQCFEKSDLRVRVGLKETEDPVWVCYCFDISKKMISKEIESTGYSASGDRIRQEVADKNCDCKIKNPSGRCCLGEVLATEKKAQKNLKRSPG